MGRSKNDVTVGLFVMLGLAALVFLALQSANLLSLNLDRTYRITANFDNIGGLKPKAAVRSAGVVVGGWPTSASTTRAFRPGSRLICSRVSSFQRTAA